MGRKPSAQTVARRRVIALHDRERQREERFLRKVTPGCPGCHIMRKPLDRHISTCPHA